MKNGEEKKKKNYANANLVYITETRIKWNKTYQS